MELFRQGDQMCILLPHRGQHQYCVTTRLTCVCSLWPGREWAAATTEGLMIYSLDQRVVFDPYELEMDITPSRVRAVLSAGDYARSLIMALRLNEEVVIQEVLESTPVDFGQCGYFASFPCASCASFFFFFSLMCQYGRHSSVLKDYRIYAWCHWDFDAVWAQHVSIIIVERQQQTCNLSKEVIEPRVLQQFYDVTCKSFSGHSDFFGGVVLL